jgi:hypothetical protein
MRSPAFTNLDMSGTSCSGTRTECPPSMIRVIVEMSSSWLPPRAVTLTKLNQLSVVESTGPSLEAASRSSSSVMAPFSFSHTSRNSSSARARSFVWAASASQPERVSPDCSAASRTALLSDGANETLILSTVISQSYSSTNYRGTNELSEARIPLVPFSLVNRVLRWATIWIH